MTADSIRTAVLEVLEEVQKLTGRPWEDLAPTAIPIDDLEGFDSITAVEATAMIEQKLGAENLNLITAFVSEDGKRPLSIEEVGERISEALKNRGSAV
ncbi:MAG: acyl carrier protein [Terriglobia bacterium]